MLTSHGTESVFPIWIIVSSGTTPLHVVTTAVRCAVGVVASIILEGKLAQSTIWISSTSRHKLWKAKKGTIRQTKREILIHYINLHPSENICMLVLTKALPPWSTSFTKKTMQCGYAGQNQHKLGSLLV